MNRSLAVFQVDAFTQQRFTGNPAGVVLGADVPVVLTSRADNVRMRIRSAAVVKLMAHAKRAAARSAG